MDFNRNNLDHASSPYLRQHADNPVWWQEWRPETLRHAENTDRPLFVSVGYSTCHWCHVMAAGAFSDPESAEILNRDFVAIKVDREQRPDIDQVLMSFLVATTGNGGWPLNAFLTPGGDPFFAMTYASPDGGAGMPPFSHILTQVREFYDKRKSEIRSFDLPPEGGRPQPAASGGPTGSGSVMDFEGLAQATENLERAYDPQSAGFGSEQKFPPHSSLLFMLTGAGAFSDPVLAESANAAGAPAESADRLRQMATATLDRMMNRGLHDHLQGGFYRYCVDRDWTVPHFEKMLYDQAMLLWSYSLGAKLTGSGRYRRTAEGVFRCFEETFRIGDLYAAAHDADTDHHEGLTYLWSHQELSNVLNETEWDAFSRTYSISEKGNFSGRNHLVRRAEVLKVGIDEDDPEFAAALHAAEEKLLLIRNARPQPFRDEKLLTAWNALAGCGLLVAHRSIGLEGAFERALEIARALVATMTDDHSVPHDAASPTDERFLTDHAALLLLLVMLGEETDEFAQITPLLGERVREFRVDGHWVESDNGDFRKVSAQAFDQPTPSGVALAEAALLRLDVAGHAMYEPRPFSNPLAYGFAGLSSFLSQGFVHVVESPDAVPWSTLPPSAMLVRGEPQTTCFAGVCRPGLPVAATG